MALTFGSARSAENGGSGWDGLAKAGDQKQSSLTNDRAGEVSMQDFYNSSKGWNVFRYKSAAYAKRHAEEVIYACNNINIGYDQSQRLTLWNEVKNKGLKSLKDVTVKCETDCSALQRVVIYLVTGKDVGDFDTGAMKYVLESSGLFNTTFKYVSGTTLYDGDILCTMTKGHTGAIVAGNPRSTTTTTTTKPATTTTTTTVKKVYASKSANSKDSSLAGTYTTTTSLNLRDGAGTGYKILTTLPASQKVHNYGYYTNVNGTKWLFIQTVFKGVEYTGFCSIKYLKKA